MKSNYWKVLFLTLVFAVTSCGGGGNTSRVLSSISVSSTTQTLPIGISQQLTATGIFSDGSKAVLMTGVSWQSASPTIVNIDPTSGLATAITLGSATITATSRTITGSTTLNVTNAILLSIAVNPNPLPTGVGIVRQLTASGKYSDGSTRDITAASGWTTLDPTIATVVGGAVTGVAVGSTTIIAMQGSVSGQSALNVTTNTWSPAASLTAARYAHSAVELLNGKVLVMGGVNAGLNDLASTEIYDPAANSWAPAASMADARAFFPATLLNGGKVLVAGGGAATFPKGGGSNGIVGVEIYDPALDTWSPAANMTFARSGHTATLLQNGKVLVSGGAGLSPSAEVYDPTTNSWTFTASMLDSRTDHTATLLANGKVLVAGGNDAIGATASAELYDPISNSWSAAGNMAFARAEGSAVRLVDGRVLIIGGSGYNLAVVAEIYDPVSNSWSTTPSMQNTLQWETSTILGNGKVLAVGGNLPAISNAELYDSVMNTWVGAASMANARRQHTATLLPGGALLVTGGIGVNLLSSCELYW